MKNDTKQPHGVLAGPSGATFVGDAGFGPLLQVGRLLLSFAAPNARAEVTWSSWASFSGQEDHLDTDEEEAAA